MASGVTYAPVPETHVETETCSSIRPCDLNTGLPALTVGLVTVAVLFVYVGPLLSTLVLFLNARELSVFGLGSQGSSGIFIPVTVVAAWFMFASGCVTDRRESQVPGLLVLCVGFVVLARTRPWLYRCRAGWRQRAAADPAGRDDPGRADGACDGHQQRLRRHRQRSRPGVDAACRRRGRFLAGVSDLRCSRCWCCSSACSARRVSYSSRWTAESLSPGPLTPRESRREPPQREAL